MSISHWGFFPGVWTVGGPLDAGYCLPVWETRDFDDLIQWM